MVQCGSKALTRRGKTTLTVLLEADFWQLHPVTGTFLCSNPLDVPAGCAHRAMELFWQDGVDSIRSFWQLTELMRCDDKWYNRFLGECRVGQLGRDSYCFLHGLCTLTAPCSGCSCNSSVIEDKVLVLTPKSSEIVFCKVAPIWQRNSLSWSAVVVVKNEASATVWSPMQ